MRSTATLLSALFVTAISCASASASTFATLFKFSSGTAENPHGTVFRDKDGALYGTAYFFGPGGRGVVFKLSPPPEGKTKWSYDILYSFMDGLGGAGPIGALVKDSSGALIGTALQGGTENYGVIFKLTPPGEGQTQWVESVIHNFSASEGNPSGDLLQDQNGNLYGTCDYSSSAQTYGQVFRLTPPQGQGDWTEDVLYVFQDRNDGYLPSPGLAGDGTALFGTTRYGGPADLGTVYQLSPPESGNGPWTKTVLHTFAGADGASPFAGVVEKNGKLFGTTSHGGDLDYGVVFQLAPPKPGHTDWKETVIHSFTGGSDGRAPYEELTIGKRGTLYGGTVGGGGFSKYGHGTIFSLTPPAVGQSQWTEQILHGFNDRDDGNSPARVWFDKSGTIYGVTQYGMSHNTGSVFQLTP